MIRGITGIESEKWVFSFRYIPELLSRAKVRTTLQYRLSSRVLIGVEYNPLADEFAPLANITFLSESRRAPAVILATSTDRIGTPDGQSFTLTISKDFKRWIRLPLAPYAGLTYGTFEDRFRPVGGLQLRLTRDLHSLVTFDGVHVHSVLTYNYGSHAFSFLLIRGQDAGFSYSIVF